MSQLYASLVRHADYAQPSATPSAHLPYPITEEGRQQARQLGESLAELLANQGWWLAPQVHTSSLLRAWQTAQLALERLSELGVDDLSLVETPELAERSVGSMANLTLDQIEAVVRDDPRFPELPSGWKSRSDFRLPFPGCESLEQAGERVAEYVRRVLARVRRELSRDTLVVFVGHGASIRHAGVALGIFESYAEAGSVSMYHAQPVTLRADTDGRWKRVAGEWKPRRQENRID